jgi:hypothetical protein
MSEMTRAGRFAACFYEQKILNLIRGTFLDQTSKLHQGTPGIVNEN